MQESGTSRAQTTYGAGDVFRISVQNGAMLYLKNGTQFESQLVTAVPDNRVVQLLQEHHVQITAEPPQQTSKWLENDRGE